MSTVCRYHLCTVVILLVLLFLVFNPQTLALFYGLRRRGMRRGRIFFGNT